MSKMQEIGTRDFIKALMAQKGITVKELAEKLNKTPANVSMFIRGGSLTLKTLDAVMSALDEPIQLELKNGNKYIININL